MRIYKRGKTWYIDYVYRGRRIRRSVGRSERIADLTLKDIEVRIAKEENLGVHANKKVLFSSFAETYLAFSEVNKSPRSYRRDVTSLRVNLVPYFGEGYLSDVTAHAVEIYKTERLENVTPATVNRELACLRHLLNKAVEWGYLNVNPAGRVKLLKEPPGRMRYLETGEIRALLKECPQYLRNIVVIALNAGLRKSEIFNLKWDDVDLEAKTIIVRNSKNNEHRIIPINANVYAILRSIRRRGEYILSKRNGEPYRDIKNGFKATVRRAGIKNFRFHDLRHTFASHLAMNGWNLQTIQRLMGHRTIKMTMRYSHLSKSHLQGAVDSLGLRFSDGTNLAQKRVRERARSWRPACTLDGGLDLIGKAADLKSAVRKDMGVRIPRPPWDC